MKSKSFQKNRKHILSKETLEEFCTICKEDYGYDLYDDDSLEEIAIEFLKFFAPIYKKPKLDARLVEEGYQICDNEGASNLNKLTQRNSRLG